MTNWPRRSSDIEVLTLFPVCLTPACAPSYLARHPLPSPEALSDCELLHETTGRADWTAWIDAFIPRGLQRASVQDFSNLDMAVKAAVMGVGVVMADLVLCREELDAGTLVTPFPDMACASPCGGICLIADRERWSVPKVEAFRLWAMNAARQDQVEVEDLKAVSQ